MGGIVGAVIGNNSGGRHAGEGAVIGTASIDDVIAISAGDRDRHIHVAQGDIGIAVAGIGSDLLHACQVLGRAVGGDRIAAAAIAGDHILIAAGAGVPDQPLISQAARIQR